MSGFLGGPSNVVVRVSANITQAQQAFAQLKASISDLNAHFTMLDNNMRAMDRTLRYILVFGFGAVAKEAVNLVAEMERLNTLLLTSEGTFEAVGKKVDTLIQLASKAPFALSAITKSFQQMQAAGIKGLMDEQGNGLLKNTLDALAAFGGSAESLKLVTMALVQMQGKGVISLEELKRQLGEQIPTAIRIMAEGLGMSIAQLFSEIEKGGVEAGRGLEALSRGFQKYYGGASELLRTTFVGASQAFKTSLDAIANSLARGGALDPLTAGINLVTDAINRLASSLTSQDINSAIEGAFRYIIDNSGYLGSAAAAIQGIGTAFGTLLSALGSAMSSLPPESVGFGIVGFILFGAKGAVAGALLAPASEAIQGIVQGFSSLTEAFSAAAGVVGAGVSEIAALGMLGFFIFGRAGLKVGLLIGAADAFVGIFRAALASMSADFSATIETAKKALTGEFGLDLIGPNSKSAQYYQNLYKQKMAQYRAQGSGGAFGDISTTPLQELFESPLAGGLRTGGGAAGIFGGVETSAERASAALRRVTNELRETMEASRNTKSSFENMFGTPEQNDIYSKSMVDSWTKIVKAAEEARIKAIREGQGAAAAYQAQADVTRQAFGNMLDELNKKREEFAASGSLINVARVDKEIDTVQRKLAEFNNNVATTVAALQAKVGAGAGVAIAKFSVTLDQMARQLDQLEAQYGGGKKANEELAQAKVLAQFGAFTAQLEKMRIAINANKSSLESRNATLAQVAEMEARVVEIQKVALETMQRRTAREQSDIMLGATRSLEDFTHQLEIAQLSLQPFTAGTIEMKNAFQSAESSVRAVTDKITELTRLVEDNPALKTMLEPMIAQLTIAKAKFEQLRDAVKNGQYVMAQASKKFWDSVGESIERGLGDTLTALMNRTGKVRDALVSMYNDITKAAIQYLMKFALVQSGLSPSGTLGGIFDTLFGSIGGGASSALSGTMNVGSGISFGFKDGGVFDKGMVQKFASGGILTGPVAFPIGIAGEAGPEAIMPLERRNGRLGVRSSGGGSNYNISINAVDAASVRDLFYREGSAMILALQGRARVNRGYQTPG